MKTETGHHENWICFDLQIWLVLQRSRCFGAGSFFIQFIFIVWYRWIFFGSFTSSLAPPGCVVHTEDGDCGDKVFTRLLRRHAKRMTGPKGPVRRGFPQPERNPKAEHIHHSVVLGPQPGFHPRAEWTAHGGWTSKATESLISQHQPLMVERQQSVFIEISSWPNRDNCFSGWLINSTIGSAILSSLFFFLKLQFNYHYDASKPQKLKRLWTCS